MTLQQAEQLIKQYQALIADESTRGARRNPALLPASKSEIMSALKLLLAQLYCIGADDKKHVDPLIRAAMALDSFNDFALGATEFIGAMHNRKRELEEFRSDLQSIAPNHRFFWQQVYPLAGIDTQTKRATFFESLRDRLRFGSKVTAKPDQARSSYDYASGRYDLD